MPKIITDATRCQGHARCNAICPGVFDLDEDGFVMLLASSVSDDLAAAVREAAANCPEGAISIE
jgi:ferredoxin